MYAPQFDYYRASSVADARRLLAARPGAKLIAGGHSLIPLLRLRLTAPAALVDIGRIAELKLLTAEDGGLRIGALTTHAEIAASALVQGSCPVLAEAAARIGDPAVRNRGTIGGSLAHADPGSDLPTVLTALDARLMVEGEGGVKTLVVDTFFQGLMTTALGPSDLLTAIWVPSLGGGRGAAYEKFPHPASRYAVIGAAASIEARDGSCVRARVAVGGLVPKPTRLRSVESALEGKALSADLASKAAAGAASDLGGDVIGDIFASADYRRGVVAAYVQRAVAAAIERAR
ncbi:MAG: carbon monoxide dehydrogenase [Acidobacteria bacterium]|nr:MAG: carbon monoxide dehydrogenase [Acidobacteriota bacterium]